MSNTTTLVAPSAVREYFNADPKRQAGLPEDALAALAPGRRGRLPKSLTDAYAKATRGKRVHGVGAEPRVRIGNTTATMAEIRAAAGETGKRGPVSAAGMAQAKAILNSK